jgi:anti-sigma factor RsiW
MTEPQLPATPTAHAAHDLTLVAALAARDHGLAPGEHAQAKALLETCNACADLYVDLLAVATAVPTAAIPARPREFTLTAADAARLRPAGWRRFLKAIGSARDGMTFPLAMGLTTLGIAGLLVATIPSLAVSNQNAAQAPVGAAAGAASEGPLAAQVMSAEPDQSPDQEGGVFSGGDEGDAKASAAERNGTEASPQDIAIRDDSTGVSVLIVVAGALLILGLGLFALRWSARRL